MAAIIKTSCQASSFSHPCRKVWLKWKVDPSKVKTSTRLKLWREALNRTNSKRPSWPLETDTDSFSCDWWESVCVCVNYKENERVCVREIWRVNACVWMKKRGWKRENIKKWEYVKEWGCVWERIKERYLVSACMWDSAIVQLYRKSKKISLVEVITFKQTSCFVSKCQLKLDDISLSRIFRWGQIKFL